MTLERVTEGGDKEKYLQAKRKAKSAVYGARKSAQ